MANGYSPRDYDGYDEALDLLRAAGCPQNGPGSDSAWEMVKGLVKYRLSPEQIADHYIALVTRHFGGDWPRANRSGHGANWRITAKTAAAIKRGEIGALVW